ncbi:MAG: hypothetical protein AAF645_27060 [Myxococcota bacterium]
MKIDRRRFLQLAAALAAPACGGSGATSSRSGGESVTAGQEVATVTPPPRDSPECSRYAPTGECTGWDQRLYDPYVCTEYDPTGECVAFDDTSYGANAAPSDECIEWDPSGECIGWGQGGYAATNECVEWDPSGECIRWDGYEPVSECVQWDPSGECVGWS